MRGIQCSRYDLPVHWWIRYFLIRIKYMGDGLQQAAGDRLRDILDRFTTNPLMGVLAGMLVTVLIQSSSGTTALTVGLRCRIYDIKTSNWCYYGCEHRNDSYCIYYRN